MAKKTTINIRLDLVGDDARRHSYRLINKMMDAGILSEAIDAFREDWGGGGDIHVEQVIVSADSELKKALAEKKKLEDQLAATLAVLADVRLDKAGASMFAAQVSLDGDEVPEEMLIRAATVDDALRFIREEYCPIRTGDDEDDVYRFTVKLWPVADAGPGILSYGSCSEHQIVFNEENAEELGATE